MTEPEVSSPGTGPAASRGGAGGDSRKLPAWKWASTSRASRRRSPSSVPAAWARNAARPSAEGISIARQNRESKSEASSAIAGPRLHGLIPQCEFPHCEGSPRWDFFFRAGHAAIGQGGEEPGARDGPVPLGGDRGDPEAAGGLLQRQ